MTLAYQSRRPMRPLAVAFAAALSTIPGDAASADGFCGEIRQITELAGENFSGLSSIPVLTVGPETLTPSPDCALTRTLGGTNGYHCVWEFVYRAADATDGFEALNRLLRDCSDNGATPTLDQPVNHPDSYDLRQYVVDGIAVSASIKDKIALDRTFLFLRVEGRAGN